MDGTKSFLKSRGVWGGAIATGLGLGQMLGYAITPADIAEGRELVEGLVVSGAGILALIGRIRARQMIG